MVETFETIRFAGHKWKRWIYFHGMHDAITIDTAHVAFLIKKGLRILIIVLIVGRIKREWAFELFTRTN